MQLHSEMKKEAMLATVHRLIIYVWVFLLVLALWPYTANPVKHVKELISASAVLLLALSMLAVPVRYGSPYDWRKTPVLFLAAIWLIWGGICVLFSDFKAVGIDELRVFLTWILMGFFAARVFRDPRHIKMLFFTICCAVVLSNVYGIIQILGLDFFPWATVDIEEYRGLPSTYGNPNFAGHAMVLAIVLCIGLATLVPKAWPLILAAPMVFHLYMTQMRGGPIALAAAAILVGCVLLVHKKSRSGSVTKAIHVLLAVAIAGTIGTLAILAASRVSTGLFFPTDGSLILRYNGYRGAAEMILDRPVFGVGPGAYSRENIPYWTAYEQRWFADVQKRNMHTHNDLLETGTETGIIGLTLHVALLLALLLRSLSLGFYSDDPDRKRIAFTLAALFTTFAVDGLFGFNLRVPVSGALFFLMAGVLDGLAAKAIPVPAPVPLQNPSPSPSGKTKKSKKRAQPVAVSHQNTQPRLLVAMGLSALAALCVLNIGMVFAGETHYQKGQGARVFADGTTVPEHRRKALADAESLLLTGRRYVFWDARYSESLGHVAFRQNAADKAVSYFVQALANDPYHPHIAANVARGYLSQATQLLRNDGQGARDETDALLAQAQRYGEHGDRYCPPSPHVQDVLWRVHRAQALVAEQRGEDAMPQWHEVEHHILASLDAGTQDAQNAYRALAHVFAKVGKVDQAIPLFQHTLPGAPRMHSLWNVFETSVRERGEYFPLLDALHQARQKALAERPINKDDLAAIAGRLARCYAEYYENPSEALSVLREALRLAHEKTELWAILAGLPLGANHLDTVCAEARKYPPATDATQGVPLFIVHSCAETGSGAELSQASNDLARTALYASGQPLARDLGGAADFLASALAKLDLPVVRRAEIRANIATVYLEAGRFQDADDTFSLAIADLPENTHGRLLAARSRALASLERREEGLALAEAAAQLAPSDPMVQLTLARHLREAGRIEESRFSFRSAISALPQDSIVRRRAEQELADMASDKKIVPIDMEG